MLRKRMRGSVSTMAVLGFFILSSGLVFGGGGSLLMVPTMPQGAAESEMVEEIAANPEPAPTIAPPTPAPALSKPAPTPKPAWQVVESKSIPVAPVAASAGLVINDKTGEVLATKNADHVLPMASITKLMTAWVTLDRAKMDQKITISRRASQIPPTHMPLGEGEKLTVKELLYATLLTSANDAATALADGLGGEADFVAGMNKKAKEIGLAQTKFANPTGFDAPGHASTATDLAKLAHHLFLEYPELLTMLQHPEVSLPANADHKPYYVANFHPLVKDYPGYLGGKPGYTGNAGFTLLTVAQRGNERVIAVVLNSPDYAGESKALLDLGFDQIK